MAEYKTIKGFQTQSYATDPVAATAAWSAGGNYPTPMSEGGAAGTQTAGLGFGGTPGGLTTTAEYDGTTWAVSPGSLGTGRYANGGCGTQTAALCVSGYSGGVKNEVEEYNGSAWSEVNNIPLAGYDMLALGTQTAAVATTARWHPYPTLKTDSYEYDGTSWSAGGALPAVRAVATGVGTQTASLVMAGISTIPYGGFYQSCLEYDGSTWTLATGDLNRSGSMLAGGSGLQTAALIYGGLYVPGPTVLADTESYNGTTWTELNNLSTARTIMGSPAGTNTTALGFAGGAPAESNATEEWNDYSSTNPAPDKTMMNQGQIWYNTTGNALKYTSAVGAWASGGALPVARRNETGIGSQTAALAAGGTPPSGYPGVTTNTESYNGTAWAAVNSFNTARTNIGANSLGTQTAAQISGGVTHPPTVGYDVSEQYDGTSWTEKADLNEVKLVGASGGTTTAGFYAGGGNAPGATQYTSTETWDGTSWTETNNINTGRRYLAGGGPTSAALIFGGGPLPVISSLGLTESWDGTSWTETNNLNGARQYLAGLTGPATSTSAVAVGGQTSPSFPATNGTEKWDGTSWATGPTLGTGRSQMSGNSAASATAGLVAGGQPYSTATEEWTISDTVKTVTVS